MNLLCTWMSSAGRSMHRHIHCLDLTGLMMSRRIGEAGGTDRREPRAPFAAATRHLCTRPSKHAAAWRPLPAASCFLTGEYVRSPASTVNVCKVVRFAVPCLLERHSTGCPPHLSESPGSHCKGADSPNTHIQHLGSDRLAVVVEGCRFRPGTQWFRGTVTCCLWLADTLRRTASDTQSCQFSRQIPPSRCSPAASGPRLRQTV